MRLCNTQHKPILCVQNKSIYYVCYIEYIIFINPFIMYNDILRIQITFVLIDKGIL